MVPKKTVGAVLLVLALGILAHAQDLENRQVGAGEREVLVGYLKPTPKKLAVIWLENQNTKDLLKREFAPFINDVVLPQAAAVVEHYGVVPSQPNYVTAICGSSRGIVDNSRCIGCVSGEDNLVAALDAVRKTAIGYFGGIAENVCPVEDIPRTGYATRHNPLTALTYVVRNPNPNYCQNHHRPLERFHRDLDLGLIPDLSIIVPNNRDNGHDEGIRVSDDWLRGFLPPILRSATYLRGELIVTLNWDEGADGPGPTMFLVLSPYVKRGDKPGIGYRSSVRGTQVSVFKFAAKTLLGPDAPMFGEAVRADIPDYGDLLDPFRFILQRTVPIFFPW